MKRVGVFLTIVALVVVMTGCVLDVPGFTVKYSITISSAIGGTVTDPGTGLFRYAKGSVVNLVAEPDRGYEFICWISNLGTIADIYDPTTTMILNQNYCFVIANFGE